MATLRLPGRPPAPTSKRVARSALRAQARLLRVGGYFRFPAYLGCTPLSAASERLARDQRPVFARDARASRLHQAGRVAQARDALLAHAQRRIARNASARVAAGTLEGPVRSVRCRYRPNDSGARVHLACLAITPQTAAPRWVSRSRSPARCATGATPGATRTRGRRRARRARGSAFPLSTSCRSLLGSSPCCHECSCSPARPPRSSRLAAAAGRRRRVAVNDQPPPARVARVTV